MKYFKLAYDMVIHRFLFNLLIVLEIAAVLILTNTVISAYNGKKTLYAPYEEILSNQGVILTMNRPEDFAFTDNEDILAIMERHNDNIDYKEVTELLYQKLKGDVSIHFTQSSTVQESSLHSAMSGAQAEALWAYFLDHDVFDKLRLPLAAGRWASSEKTEEGAIEVVASGGTTAELNKVYDSSFGKLKVVGILTQTTYIPPGPFTTDNQTEQRSLFDYYQTFDNTVSLHAPFLIADQQLYPSAYWFPDSIWFVSYGKNISEEDFQENNAYLRNFGTIRSRYGEENFQTIREQSRKAINNIYLRMLPIILAAAVVVLAGLVGSIAMATVRQKKNFGIFFLCGCRWKDCTRIVLAYLSILLAAAGVLTVIGVFVMNALNMEYLIGAVYGWNNLLISLLELAVLYLLAMILPHHIIRAASPVETIKENAT